MRFDEGEIRSHGAYRMTEHASERVVAGRFRLERVLGSGGMGTVWLATDQALGGVRRAVKEVRLSASLPEPDRRELVSRALREARNAAMLGGHPNVVVVHDVVEDDGRPWIELHKFWSQPGHCRS